MPFIADAVYADGLAAAAATPDMPMADGLRAAAAACCRYAAIISPLLMFTPMPRRHAFTLYATQPDVLLMIRRCATLFTPRVDAYKDIFA